MTTIPQPAAITVDERVHLRSGANAGRVLTIDATGVTIAWDDGTQTTERAEDLVALT